jgi:hypothetical protein
MDDFREARWYAVRRAGSRRRRHGRLPLREEVEPRRPGLLARLLGRG